MINYYYNSLVVKKLKNYISKINSIFNVFLISKKIFKRPKIAEILIYDTSGADVFLPYFKNFSVEILPTRKETINIYCLFKSFTYKAFWIGDILIAYTDAFIHAVNPKLIITYIDNNPNFYTLKSRFPKVKTVFIQNGSRSEICDIFGSIKHDPKYNVDYMLVHNHLIGAKYSSYIFGETKVVGSFKSNEIPIKVHTPKKSLLFISQWHDIQDIMDLPICKTSQGLNYLHREFYEAENFVVPFLYDYCCEKNLNFKICGRQITSGNQEREYYDRILGTNKWEYIPKSLKSKTYEIVDSAEVVVFIDSTLGYEALGRGKKSACFSVRGNPLHLTDNKFGYPAPFLDNGPFWTNFRDKKQFKRILDYLFSLSNYEWTETLQIYVNDLMEFDQGNTRFVKLLEQLLPNSQK